MLISKDDLSKIEEQFDMFYFGQFQKVQKQYFDASLKLQHRENSISAKISASGEFMIDDLPFYESQQERIHQLIIESFQTFFPSTTVFQLEESIDGFLKFSFSSNKISGGILTNSSELYIWLAGGKNLYTIKKEEQFWSFYQYFSDGKEFFPVGNKRVIAPTLLEAIQNSYCLSYEEVIPSEKIVGETLHLYKIQGLRGEFPTPNIDNTKTYFLTQK